MRSSIQVRPANRESHLKARALIEERSYHRGGQPHALLLGHPVPPAETPGY